MDQTIINFLKVQKVWRLGAQKNLDPLGITLPTFLLLYGIYYHQYEQQKLPSQRQAADVSGLDFNVASQIVRYLLEHHLVNRERSDRDSRANLLSLTLAGAQLVKTADANLTRFNQEFFAGTDIKTFGQSLNTLL